MGANALNANDGILTICTDDINNVYAAGGFTDTVGILGHYYVAKWSNSNHSWTQLGTDSNKLNANAFINSICVDKFFNVYAAGNFTDSTFYFRPEGYEYVAKWNGSTWAELGTGANALKANLSINSICVDDSGNVYAAGNFWDSLGFPYVAKWNGTTWRELYGLSTSTLFINSICVDDSQNVYAGGTFLDPAGFPFVGKWNNATGTWSQLGSGFDTALDDVWITSVKVDSFHNVYAAVNVIDTNSVIDHSNVYKWNGSDWILLGGISNALNANNIIMTICVDDSGYLFASGAFTDLSGNPYVAKYDPQSNSWGEVGAGTNAFERHISRSEDDGIATLCIDKMNHLFAAGFFTDSISSINDYFYVAEYGISNLEVKSVTNDSNITVFPNPARQEINITYSSHNEFEFPEYYLYDDVGRLHCHGMLNKSGITTINVSELPPCVYLLAVGQQTFKIIKQ